MLVVTTTVRLEKAMSAYNAKIRRPEAYMINRVHSNTTSLGPRIALDSKLMLRA